MKIRYLSIILAVGIASVVSLGTYIVLNPVMPEQNLGNTRTVKTGTLQLPGIVILLNGTGSSQNPDPTFDLRTGENTTILVKLTSVFSKELPLTVTVGPSIGHQMPRGINLKFSSSEVTTPATSLLYVSIRNDTIPGKYCFAIDANSGIQGVEQDFTLLVIPPNTSSHNPNAIC